jgi:STE24 endopeptidase
MQALKRPFPPAEVKHLYDSDEFQKKQTYQLERLTFGMLHSAWDAFVSIAFVWWGFYPKTWQLAGTILSKFITTPTHVSTTTKLFGIISWGSKAVVATTSMTTRTEIYQSVIWMFLISNISVVMNLPWSVYRTFHLEARHGFNRTTPKTYVLDLFKGLLLTAIFMPPILGAVVWILLHTGPYMALYLWAFTFTLSIVMMTVYPTVIAPLFNKYDQLPMGPLREKIEALATKLDFPLKKLFVVDGSTRSAHSNAYMYGFFGNKRIVLYDTLISQSSEDQVVAVLAHEMGHWKCGHTWILFIGTNIIMACQLGLFSLARFAPGLYTSFGFHSTHRPALAALLLFQMIIGPVDEVLNLAMNIISRKFEFQADGFGVSLGYGNDLKQALCILDKENKGPPNVDELYSAYHYSHPPLPERLRAIDAGMKKKK